MKRNKKSIYNAIAATLNALSSGLFGLIISKLIIETFGSDFNGLSSTAAQIITIVMMIEGGFTIATNVALFKPYVNKDHHAVDAIVSATRVIFQKIGVASFVFGVSLIIGYSFFINTGLTQGFVILVLLMALLPVSTNLFAVMKYRIILQAEQKEYVISLSTLFTNLARYALTVFLVLSGAGMWTISFTTMIFALLNNLIIYLYVSKHHNQINYKAKPNHSAIVGTKDVLVQKITGAFYMSIPIIAITVSPGGTLLASVYAIYNGVFSLVKNILRSIIDAPRLGLGEYAAEKTREDVWEVFKQYQMVVFAMMFVLLTTVSVLIMPFIQIYAANVTDIDYYQPVMAILMLLTTLFELLHLPSGHLINMTGNFRASRNIQLISTGVLLSGIVVGTITFGIYGILSAVLLTAVLLTALEVGFIHTKYFSQKTIGFLRLASPLVLLGIPIIWLEIHLMPELTSFTQLVFAGVVVVSINVLMGIAAYFITNKSTFISFAKRTLSMVQGKVK